MTHLWQDIRVSDLANTVYHCPYPECAGRFDTLSSAYDHFLHIHGENTANTGEKANADGTNPNLYNSAFARSNKLCLDGRLTGIGTYMAAAGGFSDVWQGYVGKKQVAIKVIRPFASSGATVAQTKLLRRLWREYLAWSRHSHPNVLKCLGFTYMSASELPALVSPWMSNGTVPKYLENNPKADRIVLLLGIAKGLHYLHTCEPSIAHGDLRAGNILVSATGIPRISDFGLSRVLGEIKGMTTSSEVTGSLRWMSPELLKEDNGVTKSSDVWAFGMTMLEILSGQHPYLEFKKDVVVFGHIMSGTTPSRPQEDTEVLPEHFWAICQQCWSFEPAQRPSMQEVKARLLAYSLCKGLLAGPLTDIYLYSREASGEYGIPGESPGANSMERLDHSVY